MKNYFDLKGQVAIVTGCSTGLGVQMAKALANQGANIVVVARRQNLIERVAVDSDFFQQNAKTMIPEERYGNEGELDSAAIFLSAPSSAYVTGVALAVDGGYTCM